MALSGTQYAIRAGEHKATIVEVGASLRQYTVRGVDITSPYQENEIAPAGCGAVLVPWPNRLRGGRYPFAGVNQQLPLTEPDKGNAIHGLARWARWQPAATQPDSVTLRMDLVPQKGWPFEVRVDVTYTLHPDTGLTVTARGRNTGSDPAPFGAGFHPYLSTHGRPFAEVSLRIPAAQRILADAAAIPVGTEDVSGTPYDFRTAKPLGDVRLDDAFTDVLRDGDRASAEVRTVDGGAELWIDGAFGYLQVFTRHVPGVEDAVAIEPMSCPADAFNSGAGLVVLEPETEWTGTWGITPREG
jgi:aldose 1-epimerase